VLVDYAHTPDALEGARSAALPLTRGCRWWCSAAAGRDRASARSWAAPWPKPPPPVRDLDNPRGEDPLAIMDEIFAGIDAEGRARRARARLAGPSASPAPRRMAATSCLSRARPEMVQITGDELLPSTTGRSPEVLWACDRAGSGAVGGLPLGDPDGTILRVTTDSSDVRRDFVCLRGAATGTTLRPARWPTAPWLCSPTASRPRCAPAHRRLHARRWALAWARAARVGRGRPAWWHHRQQRQDHHQSWWLRRPRARAGGRQRAPVQQRAGRALPLRLDGTRSAVVSWAPTHRARSRRWPR
jgi:hypothetical protein